MLNSHSQFIANDLAASTVFKIPAGNLNKYITKSVSVDLTGYDEIVFSCWTRELETNGGYKKAADFRYKIELVGIGTFYFPTYPEFRQVNIGITGAAITAVKITALHNNEDYLLMSALRGVKEELPLDIFKATKTAIEAELATEYSNGVYVGTITGTAGAKTATFSAYGFIERYVTVLIKDGSHSEIHQITEVDENGVRFGSIYDGPALIYNYTGASVYIIVPVEYGLIDREISLPGIVLWGMTPEPVKRGSSLEDIYDTYTGTTATRRREGRIQKYLILIDCEAHHRELIALMAKVVRRFLAKEKIWMNGQLYNIVTEGTPTEIEPNDASEIIPKIQFNFSIEVKEEIYSRVTENPVTTDNLEIYIEA